MTIVYNKYNWHTGFFMYEAEYKPKDKEDYDRVMQLIEENPEEYELVYEY